MSAFTPTPHINAALGGFPPTVLMPGDPLRAKFIAENYFTAPRLVNNVRGVQGYTGTYKGTPVSVMASGMGMPSIGIYSYELFKYYGVNNILRVGSAGALSPDLRVRDIVLGMGCSTDSAYASNYSLPGTLAPLCSYPLLASCAVRAEEMGLTYHVGNLLSSDLFYREDGTANEKWRDMGILAIEMEGAALYMNAAKLKKNALVICTVSDHIMTGEALSAEERQTSFDEMIRLALETARTLK